MKEEIFVILFSIGCSIQFDINQKDTHVYQSINRNNDIISNIQRDALTNLFKNENKVKVNLRRFQRNIEDDPIVYSHTSNENDGRLQKFKYFISQETAREEEITVEKQSQDDEDSLRFSGKTSYIGNDGIRSIVIYIADKNGYQPKVLFGKNVEIIDNELKLPLPAVYNPPSISTTRPPSIPTEHLPPIPTLPPLPPLTQLPPPQYSSPPKGAGAGDLLCSLIGSGCR